MLSTNILSLLLMFSPVSGLAGTVGSADATNSAVVEALSDTTETGIAAEPQSSNESLSAKAEKQGAGAANVFTIKESEIPVILDEKRAVSAQGSPVGRAVSVLGILGLLALGAFYLLKRHGQPKDKAATAATIKVLSQHHLGPKKSIAIVRVAGESMLVGITDNNINLIKSLSLLDEDIPDETPKSFSIEPDEDEYSIAGIKDAVNGRLKNMRTF